MSVPKPRIPEKRYAVLPKETIRLYAEAAGFPDLTEELVQMLCEDVNYRLRDVVQQSCEFLRHSKRRKLTTTDFNQALKNSDIQPIYGHSLVDPVNFCQTKDGDVHFCDDDEVDVTVFETPTIIHPGKPTVTANWLAVEGIPTGSSMTPTMQNKNQNQTHAPRQVSENQLLYYDIVTKAILGTEDGLMQVALSNLRTNCNISSILPYFVNFVANGVKTVNHDVSQLARLLHTIEALVSNSSLFLEPKPYLSMLMQTILYCEIEPLAAAINSLNDHWVLRDYAARLMAYTVRRLDNPINQLKQTSLAHLRDALADTTRPFYTHYGAIVGLLELGVQAVDEILIPQLPSYSKHVINALQDTSYSNALIRSEAQKVFGALLLVAEYTIRAHTAILMASSSCHKKKETTPPDTTDGGGVKDMPHIAPHLSPVVLESGDFTERESSADLRPHENTIPSLLTFTDLYLELYEQFGDSLACRLPIVRIPDYYRPRKEPDRVSFADADTAKSGEELLKQFLFDGSGRGNQSSRGRFSTENGETEMKSNRSSHSSISDEYTGDDADLSIKASVNDPSHGIKLTIFKRPKSKSTPEVAQPLAAEKQSTTDVKITKLTNDKKSNPVKKPSLAEMFELTTLRGRDALFMFRFQGRIQLCTFTERKKMQILARNMALQHASVSRYRNLCAQKKLYGKPKNSLTSVPGKPHINRSEFNLLCPL